MRLADDLSLYNIWRFQALEPLVVKDKVLRVAEKFGFPIYRDNEISINHYKELWRLFRFEDAILGGGGEIYNRTTKNLTVNEGLDEILDKFWKGSSYTAAHYVGLTDGTPSFAAGDTMSTHAGWSEVTAYSETNRQDLTLGTVSSQSVNNSSSKASFSINSDSTTVGGGFISTDNTKGGTTGILIGGAADSGGDQTLNSGSTLNITATLTASSS